MIEDRSRDASIVNERNSNSIFFLSFLEENRFGFETVDSGELIVAIKLPPRDWRGGKYSPKRFANRDFLVDFLSSMWIRASWIDDRINNGRDSIGSINCEPIVNQL